MIVDLLSFSALLRVFYKTESFDTAYRKREQSTYFLPPYAPLILLLRMALYKCVLID